MEEERLYRIAKNILQRDESAIMKGLAEKVVNAFENGQPLSALKRREPRQRNGNGMAKLRYLALTKSKGKCECCGLSAKDGAVLHVDHIKPASLYPELSRCIDNLQVLCEECNLGKGASDQTNWKSL